MEDEYKAELRRKLETGEISQELYDEIMKRWSVSEQGKEEKKETESKSGTASTKEGETKISGSGHLSSVVAKNFEISGSGHISGIVDVDYMEVSGSGKIAGDITVSGDLEASGSLVAERSITAGTIDSSGSLKAGSIKARELESSGSLHVYGNIDVESMDLSGGCIAENITCKNLESSGVLSAKEIKGIELDISGGIRVDTVECESFSMSIEGYTHRNNIGKLVCKDVQIESGKRFFKSSVDIDEIICQTASLESVRAKRVIGEEVVIGDGCEIDYVEAKVIKTSGDAVVKEKKNL